MPSSGSRHDREFSNGLTSVAAQHIVYTIQCTSSSALAQRLFLRGLMTNAVGMIKPEDLGGAAALSIPTSNSQYARQEAT